MLRCFFSSAKSIFLSYRSYTPPPPQTTTTSDQRSATIRLNNYLIKSTRCWADSFIVSFIVFIANMWTSCDGCKEQNTHLHGTKLQTTFKLHGFLIVVIAIRGTSLLSVFDVWVAYLLIICDAYDLKFCTDDGVYKVYIFGLLPTYEPSCILRLFCYFCCLLSWSLTGWFYGYSWLHCYSFIWFVTLPQGIHISARKI